MGNESDLLFRSDENVGLDEVLKSIPDAVFTMDRQMRINYFSKAAEMMTGFPAKQAKGMYCRDVLKTDMCDMECNIFKALRIQENIFDIETVFKTIDNEKIPILISASIIRDSAGKVCGFVHIFKSIVGLRKIMDDLEKANEELEKYRLHLEDLVEKRTSELKVANKQLNQEVGERKRAEEELKAFTKKLEQSNQELQDFAYIASHDLQEPLRKVTAFGDRLKAKCGDALNEQGRDYLGRMQNAAERMKALIDGLLAYSRITTKGRPFVPVDLATLSQEVVSDLEVRIEQTGGRVEIGDLPTIEADPLQLRQLLQNLIGNALKFQRKEHPPIIKIHSKRVNGEGGESSATELCQITVADNGIGFDEKYREDIFGVFQRLHGRNEYEGTGIGLSVCRKIVKRHGGSITAISTPGQGATFIATLPVKQPKEENNG